MNGVEILAVEQVATVFKYNWMACGITAGIIVLVIFVVSIFNARNEDALAGLISIGFILSAIFGGLAAIYFAKPIEYANQYTVTVSDNVSMNEFMDKYDLIEQDGRVYTVRERD